MSKSITKSVKKTKIKQTDFIRLPVDDTLQVAIDQVMAENPFFTRLDAIRFMLGKFILRGYKKPNGVSDFLRKYVRDNPDVEELSEDEAFDRLREHGLL